jgi:hypothetical protein
MPDPSDCEVRRLRRLQQGIELRLEILTTRRSLTATDRAELKELQQSKIQLDERIALLEAALLDHSNSAAE